MGAAQNRARRDYDAFWSALLWFSWFIIDGWQIGQYNWHRSSNCLFVSSGLSINILISTWSGTTIFGGVISHTKDFTLAEVHADLFSRHASSLVYKFFFVVVDEGDECYVRRELSSTQRKTVTNKEARRRKCVAPRLVCDSALSLFFETFIHVYVRTTYDQTCLAKKRKNGGQVSGWTRRTCVQHFRVYLIKMAWGFRFWCGKTCAFCAVIL